MSRIALIILEQAFLNFPIVLGAYISISLMKVPDLSIESAYVFGAIISSQVLIATSQLPLPICFTLVILAAMFGGTLVGMVSGLLTRKARLPHLLSAILTTGLFHGFNQFVLGTSNLSISKYPNLLGMLELKIMPWLRRNPELPSLSFAFIAISIIGFFFLKTQLGYSFAVHGNNPGFFEHYSISSNYVFMSGILISNGLAGLAGYFDATSGGFVDINMGAIKALFCVTALILGKTLVQPKRPLSILVPIVGVISYFIIQQLLLKVGFNLKYFTMIQSLIVLTLLVIIYQKKTGKIDHLGV